MYVLQHDPIAILDALFYPFVRQLEPLRTSDCHRVQLRICLLRQLLYLETGVEPRGARKQNRLFRPAAQNCILKVDSVIFRTLFSEDCPNEVEGDRAELVGPENFNQYQVDQLFSEGRHFSLDFGDLFLRVGAGDEFFPSGLIILDHADDIVEDGVFRDLLDLFELVLVKDSIEHGRGQLGREDGGGFD